RTSERTTATGIAKRELEVPQPKGVYQWMPERTKWFIVGPRRGGETSKSGMRRSAHLAHQRERVAFGVLEKRHPQLVVRHFGDQVRLPLEWDAALGQIGKGALNV